MVAGAAHLATVFTFFVANGAAAENLGPINNYFMPATLVLFVIVVIDPGAQTIAEAVDEGLRDLRKAPTAARAGERDVEHGHASEHLARTRQLTRSSEG